MLALTGGKAMGSTAGGRSRSAAQTSREGTKDTGSGAAPCPARGFYGPGRAGPGAGVPLRGGAAAHARSTRRPRGGSRRSPAEPPRPGRREGTEHPGLTWGRSREGFRQRLRGMRPRRCPASATFPGTTQRWQLPREGCGTPCAPAVRGMGSPKR